METDAKKQGTRRRFDKQFKADAVEQVLDKGRRIVDVAKGLGIAENNWKRIRGRQRWHDLRLWKARGYGPRNMSPNQGATVALIRGVTALGLFGDRLEGHHSYLAPQAEKRSV